MVKLIHRQVNNDGTITVAFGLDDDKPKRVCILTKIKNMPRVVKIEEVAKDKMAKALSQRRCEGFNGKGLNNSNRNSKVDEK